MAKRGITGFIAIVGTLALTTAPLCAQGTSGLQFLTARLGARAVALGEAYTGVAEGVEGMIFNPASAATVRSISLSLSVLDAADLFHQSLIAVGVPVLGNGAVGMSINYQRFEPIQMTDVNGNQVGQFSPQTMVLSGTFGYRWSDHLHTGVTAKWFYSELAAGGIAFLGPAFNASASGVAFDVGLTYAVGTGNAVQFGVALLDLGPDVTFNRESDQLPTRLRLGVAAHPVAAILGSEALGPVDVMLVADGVLTTEGTSIDRGSVGYGVELALNRILYLRAGLPAEPGTDNSRPFRYGIGLTHGVFRFDVARRLEEHPALGQETHVSLNVAF